MRLQEVLMIMTTPHQLEPIRSTPNLACTINTTSKVTHKSIGGSCNNCIVGFALQYIKLHFEDGVGLKISRFCMIAVELLVQHGK